MKIASFMVLSCLPLLAQTVDLTKPPVSREQKPYKLPPITESKLANGLTVMLVDDKRFPLVTMRLVFLAGNKRDPKDIPGLAAAVASMLTQGTAHHSYEQLARDLDSLGATISVGTGADSMTIDASALAENSDKVLSLVAEVATDAIFPTGEVDLYRQNRKQTLAAQHAQAAFLADEQYRAALFGDTPYGHVGPTAPAIDKMDRETLIKFRDTYLVPNNAFLILVGALPPRTDLNKTITNLFGSWTQKQVPAYVAPKLPEAKRQLLLVDRPGSVQADMRIGKVSATFSDPAYFPEIVGSVIEGGGPNSRLFLDIREKRGYAYQIYTQLSPLTDAAVMTSGTQARNDVAADALQGILEHLDRMAKEPVQARELSDAKTYANGVYLLGMEPQRGLADRLVQMKVMNLPKNYLDTYTTKINSVEPDQIQQAAKKYMAPDDATIVVVGDAHAIQKSLEKVGTFTVVKPQQ